MLPTKVQDIFWIEEPVAAAVYVLSQYKAQSLRLHKLASSATDVYNVLVIDLGGATADFCFMKIDAQERGQP